MRQIRPELVKHIDGKLKNPSSDPVELLRATLECLVGVHEEGGNNRGKIVELLQDTAGKPNRQAWCMDFIQSAIAFVEQRLHVVCALPATEGTQFMADWANTHGKLVQHMMKNHLIIWKHTKKGSTGGHVAFVMEAGRMLTTIEGNTGAGPGVVSEGDGVYRKERDPHGAGEMVIRGYVPVTFAPKSMQLSAMAAAPAGVTLDDEILAAQKADGGGEPAPNDEEGDSQKPDHEPHGHGG